MVCHEMAFLPPPSSDHQFFFQNHHQQLSEHHHDAAQNHHQSNSNSDPTSLSILTSSCPPQDFLGHPHLSTLTMMNHHHHSLSPSTAGYGGGGGSLISNDQFTAASNNHHHVGSNTNSMNGEEDALSEDEASHFMALGEKKKRLNMEQVKTLEKNFELGNKLEPERKMQLAKALGLQPRQVAIWFQNRRARWKTKQLEKDYNLLKRQFDNLKADNELLQTQNKKLHAELVALKNGKEPAPTAEFEPAAGGGGGGDGAINLNTETKSYCWSNNGSDISSDINLGISTTPTPPHGDHHHHHQQQQQPHSPPPPACNIDNNHKLQFQSSFLPMSLTDLLTKPSSHHPHHDHTLQDDGFCTLFGAGGGSGGGTGTAGGGGVASEQPPPFWAWPTDQHRMQ